MPGVSVIAHNEPSPLWGGLGGGPGSPAPAGEAATNKLLLAADAASPPPTSPTRGEELREGFRRLSLPAGATEQSRRLRRTMTKPERLLWRALRVALPEQHWRRQVPFGPYIADFCSHGAKLIIEVDGGQHAGAVERDIARTAFLETEGYRVIRFWNNDVLGNPAGVIDRIAAELEAII